MYVSSSSVFATAKILLHGKNFENPYIWETVCTGNLFFIVFEYELF